MQYRIDPKSGNKLLRIWLDRWTLCWCWEEKTALIHKNCGIFAKCKADVLS